MSLPTRPSRIYSRASWTLLGILLGSFCFVRPVPAQGPIVRPLTTYVPIWRRDSVGIRQMAGKLIVMVRDVTRPSEVLRQVQVIVFTGKDESLPPYAFKMSDSLGMVRLDSVPAGRPFVRLRALGYHPLLVPVEIIAGCTTFIEAYLSPMNCDIGPCDPTPPRVTLTLCREPKY